MLDDDERWRVVPGEYVVSCGLSSADPHLHSVRVWLGG